MFEGPRGCGKSEVGLAKFGMHVDKGFGNHWRGVIFRREFDELEDIKVKGERFFQKLSSTPIFLRSAQEYKFVWQTGEELLLRHIKDISQYWRWHGQEYPFIHWEELTTWYNLELYDMLKSINRSPIVDIPRIYSSSTNPFGPGHSAVKRRFIDPVAEHRGPNGVSFDRIVAYDEQGNKEKERIAVFTGSLEENPYIAINDPEYLTTLKSIADPNKRKAWVLGDWDIAVGDFFEGYWDDDKHVTDAELFPKPQWECWRAFDWGSGRPYAVGWFTLIPPGQFNGNKRPIIAMYRELYGWGGSENVGTRETATQIAQKIYDLEVLERDAGITFRNNPADHDIFGEKGYEHSLDEKFRAKGIAWYPAKKGPKSRVAKATLWREYLSGEHGIDFIVRADCTHFRRTVPSIPTDPDNPEDVDTDAEDHMYDMGGMAIMSRHTIREDKPKDKPVEAGTWDATVMSQKEQRKLVRLPEWAR